MAYLKDFEHDVFISYCHDDNEVAKGENECGWVDHFADQFLIALKQASGQRERIDVWRDPALSRAQLLSQAIETAVRGSGVLLVLLSKAYQNSDSCRQEMTWFLNQAKRTIGLEVGGYRRVLPILLQDIPPKAWPEGCKATLGFTFHHTEGEEKAWPLDPDSKEFRKQLRQLVGAVWAILQKLEQETDVPTDEGLPFRVFLSCPPVDLKPTHEQLREALGATGIEVRTGIPPPDDEASHVEAVKQAVEWADLSIHLLGLEPGKALPRNPRTTYPVKQAEIGLEHARSQLFLMREEFDVKFVEDSAYAEFIRSLTERQRDASRLEVIRTDRHQMLDEILAKRQRLKAINRAKSTAEMSAFIDLHPKDWSRAGQLVAYLDERKIPWRVEHAAEPSLFARALKSARLFLVVFGEVARDWVVERINRAVQISIEEDLRILLAVFVATRRAREQAAFGGSVKVVYSEDRFDPARIDSLLEKVSPA